MGLSATLDPSGAAIAFAIREDADFGRVLCELLRVRQGRYGVPRVVATDRSEPRAVKLSIIIDKHGQGVAPQTDADAAAAELSTINRLLGKPCSIAVKDDSLTLGITLRTLPSPGSENPSNVDTRPVVRDGVLLARLEIVCEPYAYGSVQTLVNVTPTALPAQIDLAAMSSEYESPLSWSLVLAGMTQLHLGLLEEQYAAWTGWLLDANALTWTGGASAADAAAAGGAAWKITTALASKTASIPVTDFPQGEYALLVRARVTSGIGTLWSSSIHADADEGQTVASSAYKWYDLGRIVCPTKRTISPGSASVTLTADATTGDVLVDRIAFVRTSAGYVAYDGPGVNRLDCDGEHTYAGGLVDYRYTKGGVLYPSRGKLCAIVEKDGSAASYSPTVTIAAETRHNLWR